MRSPFLEGDAATKLGDSGFGVSPDGDCGAGSVDGVVKEASGRDMVLRKEEGEGG